MCPTRSLPLLLVAALALAGAPARADVSPHTGELSEKVTDLTLKGGIEPSLERFYRSNHASVGMFGRGWMSQFDTFLEFEESGSIVLHEEAMTRRFLPLDSSTPSARDASAVPVGRRYEARCPFQHLERTAAGFDLVYDSGRTLSFDALGRLAQVKDRSGNFFRVAYGANSRPAEVTDDGGRSVRFEYGALGLVERARDSAGREARFRYGPFGTLIEARDTAGLVHRYTYDPATLRLTGIGSEGEGGQAISYDAEGRVRSVEDGGAITGYFYARDPAHPSFLRVDVHTAGTDGGAISDVTYEYELFDTGFGDEGVLRLRTVEDGLETDTRYNACCGRPTSIQRGDELVTFTYDDGGHLVRKTGPFGEKRVQIDLKSQKVSEVHELGPSGREEHWARYRYDGGANLVEAESSEGKKVTLSYDAKSRIQRLEDNEGHVLEFEYNESSKPVVIRERSIGTLRVAYDAEGEVKNVDSDGGRKIALAVTSAFQNLLDIIRPASVTETW